MDAALDVVHLQWHRGSIGSRCSEDDPVSQNCVEGGEVALEARGDVSEPREKGEFSGLYDVLKAKAAHTQGEFCYLACTPNVEAGVVRRDVEDGPQGLPDCVPEVMS